jgi:putative peptidoglycan binding protein
MTQTPEDEWFAPDDADSPTDTPRQSSEDDWLVTGDRTPRPGGLDLAALNTAHGLAAIGIVAVTVIALVAAVVALTERTPPAFQVIPIVSRPPASPHISRTSTPAPPVRSLSAPTTTLKPGDTGPQVKTLQRELRALGYAVGAIDGSYGTQTSKAVMAFQRAHHLTVDGIVGPRTLQALSP